MVPNTDFLITQLESGESLADKYEKTLGTGLDLAPAPAPTPTSSNPQKATSPIASERTRPEGVPADYEFHPTSTAPEGTEPKYIDTKGRSPGYWAPTAKVTSELPPTPVAPASKSDATRTTPSGAPAGPKDAAPASTVAPVAAPPHTPATIESRRAKAAVSRREIIEDAILQAASEGKPLTPYEITQARKSHPIPGEVAYGLPQTEKSVSIDPKDKTAVPAPAKAPTIPAANDSWKQWQADPVTEVIAADSAPTSIPVVAPPAAPPRVKSNRFTPSGPVEPT